MRKNKNILKKAAAFTLVTTMMVGGATMNAFAYGEETESSSAFRNSTDASSDFQTWRDSDWRTAAGYADTGKIALTPGKSQSDLNFAWYSESAGTPAVMVWRDGNKGAAQVVTGTATAISAENWQGKTYAASNKVSVDEYFSDNTLYHYQYTDNYTGDSSDIWSSEYSYKTADSSSFSVILTGDPQVGASSSGDDYSEFDSSAARDTYNWNINMNQAMNICPDAAFLLSAGDQINQSGVSSIEDQKTRESEYAGYLYPEVFRSLPIAATIGNHDMAGADYTQHFNNPNSSENLGATAAGCDYYFTYGDALFISLNSNNRNQSEHRQLLTEAVNSAPDAKWKVVIFHSDIYGSGQPHADTDATANRIIFAPLMDEFDIDICLTGHDHTYSRSYQILDGNVIDYDISNGEVTDPEGTLYITTGSGSGSKYYNLLNYTPYYIAERTNACLPAFSTIDFSGDAMTLKTYDYTGAKYADDFTIKKSESVDSVDSIIANAENKLSDVSKYTEDSVNALQTSLDTLKAMKENYTTDTDLMVQAISDDYPAGNLVKGYGQITNDSDKDNGKNRLIQGKSTLLDKTYYLQAQNEELPIVDAQELNTAKTAVLAAINELTVKPAKEGQQGNQLTTAQGQQGNQPTAGQGQQASQQTVKEEQKVNKAATNVQTKSPKTGETSSFASVTTSLAALLTLIALFSKLFRKKDTNCER